MSTVLSVIERIDLDPNVSKKCGCISDILLETKNLFFNLVFLYIMSQQLKELLKLGTSIDHNFIDEFYEIFTNINEEYTNTQYI